MALIRWDPVREVDTLQQEVNRVFDAFFGTSMNNTRRWVPAMDMVETDDHLILRADLPGLTKDDVNVEIKDRVLTLSGERKAEHKEDSEGYYRIERAFGSFSRSLTLPAGVSPESVEAEFNNGVLEVRIPKPEESKPYRIEIGGSAPALEGKAEETTVNGAEAREKVKA